MGKNTGASGGNGMQSFSIGYLAECEINNELKGGHVVPCSHCGEEYHLEPCHLFDESIELVLFLRSNGCPHCNYKKPFNENYLEWFQAHKNKLETFTFT